ncbi:Clp protease ClpP [Paenibacillus larvae]|uniref:head maturation protease, ClpP-related n=1 Tax=Paenibacillus larvae TaxID=1464 RepID=UPI0022820FDB|nr:head maturation protease, ClpP-related [Paenibacillus larvae]MCY9511873.1 Clp protease ClpP [Paenibacillus larvae]MCY9526611.1 Clp protease ClpP [Paenibacillus larvae]
MKKFWNMKKTANNSGELTLYGTVSEYSWWGDDITPQQFRDDLYALGDVDDITVRLNSPGGDVFAGLHIYQVLKEHKANVTVRVEGFAGSIASIIAMAGDKVIMPKGSMMMVHNPWTFTMGESSDLRQTADILDTIRDALVEVYMARTGLQEEELNSLLDSETWMTSAQAVEKGFADEEEQTMQISACLRGRTAIINGLEMDWSGYAMAPDLPKEENESISALGKVQAVLAMPKQGRDQNQDQGSPKSQDMTLDMFAQRHPDLYKAAVQAGMQQERNRMKELDELAAVPSARDVIAKAKYETGVTAQEIAVDILKAEKNRIEEAGNQRLSDSRDSGIQNLLPQDPTNGEDAEEVASGLANAMKKLRGGK